MGTGTTGISGLGVYVPPFRVDLGEWCTWCGEDWNKIRDVVGTGFRLPGPQHSVYTMAANAILRLIEQYDINPEEVRYLALGTESSTDNSAGAGLVVGPQVQDWCGISLLDVPVELRLDGGAKEPTNLMPRHDPVDTLCWLANELSSRSIGLTAGQFITTGSATMLRELPPGSSAVATFGDYGVIEIALEAA